MAIGQPGNMKGFYSSPLNIPLSLSGNFCEIRTNHFHSGIDLRTYGKEGFPVLAAADGFVSRIKVSSVGYGKALYITHPNGTVTVYGHLRQFAEPIRHFVETTQQSRQQFEVELFPDSTQFIIQQGQPIGLSGNSGGSEAPHLHFEIRDRYTEEPMNPLTWIQIADTTFPVITHVAVYANNNGEHQRLMVLKTQAINDSVYSLDDTIRIPANISTINIAFVAYDKAFSSDSNDVNIYAATLMNGADTIFNYSYDRLNFDDTKYVNAHIDYEAKFNYKIKLERCFRLPGDMFPAFKNSGKGMISLADNEVSNPKLIVKDFAGNSSTLLLEIAKDSLQFTTDITAQKFLSFDWDHLIKSQHATLFIAKGSLYEDIREIEIAESNLTNFYSPVVKIFDKTIPLHKNAELNILSNKIPSTLQLKTLIASLNDQNKITGSSGGVYKKGWVTTKVSSLGNYTITVDTIPPAINQMQITIDSVCMCPVLSVKLTDDLSGIENFIGCMDNEWALMEWDRKTERLLYYIKPETMGPHQLTIQASDQKENRVYIENGF